jgi:cytochrome c-type biogenesis protein CcmH
VAPVLSGSYGAGDARKEKLYSTFIAPCCWRENLAVHDSPTAGQLRTRIDGLISQGRSDDQVKALLVGEYGPRILALPEGTTRRWLFWTPFAVAIAGLAAVVLFLRRLKLRGAGPDLPPAKLPDHWEG